MAEVMNEILKIEDLSVSYSSSEKIIEALKNINLSVKEGTVLGIVGESGCGKTTLAMSIGKLLPDNAKIISGKILFNGLNLSGLCRKELEAVLGKQIGYIFQDPTAALNPVLNIGQQLVETISQCQRKYGDEAREEACRLLKLVNIPNPAEHLKFYPHQLSGGLNQRVMIALALAGSPKLLIADEPTSNLDVTIGAAILGLLCDLRARLGLSIIFITHDLTLVSFLADETAVMNNGRIIELRKTAELFNDPREAYTKELLSSSISTSFL